MSPPPIAHSANAAGRTHDLRQHLEEVAELAAGFAAKFGTADYARAAGLWHDLGKNAPDFQSMLRRNARERIDHKHAGAIRAIDRFGRGVGLPLAFVITGHHAGIPDLVHIDGPDHLASPEYKARLAGILADPAAVTPDPPRPPRPAYLARRPDDRPGDAERRYEFWVRMLLSCLVDADHLDTEAFRDATTAGVREAARHRYATPAELLAMFDRSVSKFAAAAGTVNEVRRRVLADCRAKGAGCPPGVFTLTAPTGSGKTLAGMGFALEHAVARGLDRVIVVIPYTSIIDQNARVYRGVFGAGNVIDHHASLDPQTETAENRLAAENWDAPVVVTTSVQFVESLLANRPSKCRKLHNVCKSVVLFDEVQTLPAPHLVPIVDVLKELVGNYGVSLVLSTATQPALKARRGADGTPVPGFGAVTEIVSDVPGAFAALRRVDVRWPANLAAPTGWPALAGELAERDEVLCIVHRRDDARDLVRELDLRVPGTTHLSALMCATHRLTVIDRIKDLLEANRRRRARGEAVVPVRVVATQLVEAGVDLDFPAVYRAFGGLDSLAQAAGRCNREGRLGDGRRGEVVVFVAPTKPPDGTPRKAADVARRMLAADPQLDPLDPAVYDRYFRDVYAVHEVDPAGVQAMRAGWQFRTLAESFSMIEDDGSEAVVVPYGDAPARLAEVERLGPSRGRLRALQPFVVTVYPHQLQRLRAAGVVREVAETVQAVDVATHAGLYSDRFGLVLDGPFAVDPGTLVC